MTDKQPISLFNDPQIAQASKQIVQRVQSLNSKLKVCEPNPKQQESYQSIIDKFSQQRAGGLWYPYLGSGQGNGPLVELCDGSVKYDLICGIGPHFFGHSHPKLIEAALEGAIEDIAMQGHLQQNPIACALTDKLINLSGMDHCFLSSIGAMANENAFKILFQKKFPANRVMAFDRCFLGRTIAMASVTDKPGLRQGVPKILNVDYIPFYNHKDPEGSTEKTLQAMNTFLKRYPGEHAFITAELVQGEGGFYPGTETFFKKVFARAKEANLAVLCDEIQTFGRTPSPFAFHYFNLQDYVDVVCIGKVSYICATLFKKEFKPGPGLLSQTFIGSTSALHVTDKIIDLLSTMPLYGQSGSIHKLHQQFVKVFEFLNHKYPESISGPYGLGAMIAFTLYNGDLQTTRRFLDLLFHKGLICFPAGSNPTRIRILPPMGVLSEQHIDEIGLILDQALSEFDPKI